MKVRWYVTKTDAKVQCYVTNTDAKSDGDRIRIRTTVTSRQDEAIANGIQAIQNKRNESYRLSGRSTDTFLTQ